VNSSDLLRLDAQLCFLLYAASRSVTQAYVPLLAPLGLTYPQYLVMLVLWEEEDLTLGRIGERLRLDSGTLTPLIKRMEAAGLVARERSREDERVLHVRLTDDGRRLRARAAGVPLQMFCQTGLTSTAADRLASDLRHVLEALRDGRVDGSEESRNDNNRRAPGIASTRNDDHETTDPKQNPKENLTTDDRESDDEEPTT
jgi:MarR family transcriptional regulator, organic hydroperoxide resistance regulator